MGAEFKVCAEDVLVGAEAKLCAGNGVQKSGPVPATCDDIDVGKTEISNVGIDFSGGVDGISSVSFVVYFCCFRRYLGSPVPASVRVLDSKIAGHSL